MKQFMKLWLALLFMIVVQSCYKDKGNYELVDYNKIKDDHSAHGNARGTGRYPESEPFDHLEIS